MYKILKCYMADNGVKWCVVDDNGKKYWAWFVAEEGEPPKDVQEKALQDFTTANE